MTNSSSIHRFQHVDFQRQKFSFQTLRTLYENRCQKTESIYGAGYSAAYVIGLMPGFHHSVAVIPFHIATVAVVDENGNAGNVFPRTLIGYSPTAERRK